MCFDVSDYNKLFRLSVCTEGKKAAEYFFLFHLYSQVKYVIGGKFTQDMSCPVATKWELFTERL